MKYLLDTHVFIWWHQDKTRLANAVIEACEDARHELYLSMASIWEMQIKISLGKLEIADSLEVALLRQAEHGIQVLGIQQHHILGMTELPEIHADPFDRLLASQSRLEEMTLITADRRLQSYPIKTFWQ